MEGPKKIGGRHLSMILWSLTLSAPFAVSPSDLAPIQSDKGIKIFLPLSPIWAALELCGDVSGVAPVSNRGRCSVELKMLQKRAKVCNMYLTYPN